MATGETLARARLALGLALAIHLLFLLSLREGLLDRFFNDATHRGAPGSDFFVVYKAGRNLVRGDSPYHIDPEEPPASWRDYRYLPLSAMTLSVLVSRFPPERARRLWILVNEGLLAAAIAASVRLAKSRGEGMVAAGLWLAFSPYYLELYVGQFDFLVAAGLLGAACLMLGRSRILGAASWLLATAVKWNGLVIAPMLLQRRRWRVLAVWASAALSTGAVFFLLRPDDLAPFRSTVLRGGFATPHAGNHGFQALVSSTMSFVSPGIFLELQRWAESRALILTYANLERALLIAALALATAATFMPHRRLTVGEGLALWTSFLAFGWNEFWEHQYVLLLPGLVLLYLEGRRRLALGVWWPLAVPTVFALVDRSHAEVVAATPAGYDNPDLFVLLGPSENFLLHACKALPAAVLFIAVARGAWVKTEEPHREPLAAAEG